MLCTQVAVLKDTAGDMTFSTLLQIATIDSVGSLAVADFDLDGDMDFVAGPTSGDGTLITNGINGAVFYFF